MIKLIDLLKEEESLSPEELGKLGFIMGKPGEKEFLKKGYALLPGETDPETGAITHNVVNMPKFDKFRADLQNIKKPMQFFKRSDDKYIKEFAEKIIKETNSLINLIIVLEERIKLEKEQSE